MHIDPNAKSLLPFDQIVSSSNFLLSEMGKVTAGPWLLTLVSIDAFMVLSGAVLTAYVGVSGLVRQVASDRCLPSFLLAQNSWRKTNHYIIFGFFLLSSSLLMALQGNLTTLAGVYTVAFLSVMLLFALGCALLKLRRPDIRREAVASWWCLVIGAAGVLLSLLGNIVSDPIILLVWLRAYNSFLKSTPVICILTISLRHYRTLYITS